MTVAVSTGVAYVTATPTGGASQKIRVKNNATATVTIAANATGSTRYDWLYVKIDPDKAIAPNAAATDVASLVTSRSSSQTTDNGTPPTYGTLLAIVTVANGASSITNGTITDSRAQASISSVATVSAGWTSLGSTPATITANGNRSYSCVFNSVDLTGTLSAGMRLLLTRTVAAPTKCTSLNGTTQYYSKASPSGMTFTDDFTVSAWIKLSSYAVGSIASRYNGTSGWDFRLEASGQLTLIGYNAGAGNFSGTTSYQSVPLNKWVHVAAQLDMSTFTATTTTSYTMIDGVDVPASVSQGGTNPTALVQAGNLEIGSRNGGSQFFPGKLAQVAIYSAKVTQATILASMNQTLAGTETSLISAYSFSNSINDLSANANNLTANGSAVATSADSPFAQGATAGTLEYGIVASTPTFSTNTTVVVDVPEGSAIPTSGGISAVSYSSQKVPYGLPAQRGKWRLESLFLAAGASLATPVLNTYYNIGSFRLNVPIGERVLGFRSLTGMDRSVAGRTDTIAALSTSSSSVSDLKLTAGRGDGGGNTFSASMTVAENQVSLAAATIYYHIVAANQSVSAGNLYLFGGSGAPAAAGVIYADNAHL
jgi:hypothetical protein